MTNNKPVTIVSYSFSYILGFDEHYSDERFPIEANEQVIAQSCEEAEEVFSELGYHGLDGQISISIEK